MSHALLLVPDFLLILCGFALCRWTALDRSVWDGVERLVYYLLFPVLLFNSIVKSPLQPGATLGLALSGLAVIGSGVLLAYALRWLPGVDPQLHASGAALIISSAPIEPPPPDLFSISTCWPSSLARPGPITRAMMSVVPPGANGTTRWITLFG